MPEPRFFGNLVPYGQPTVTKADTTQTEPRAHGNWGEHDHGTAAFSDEELKLLQEQGFHVDAHTSFVYDHGGRRVSPGHVGQMLSEAHQKAPLRDDGPSVDKIAQVTRASSTYDLRALTGRAPGES